MNKTMIICIDYDMRGNLHITDIFYDQSLAYIKVKERAKDAKEYRHEVYTVDINDYDSAFIDAIRKEGDKI